MIKAQHIFATALCGVILCGHAGAAKAECQTLSFSVNDYGKEGPARDATNLLEKHIARWTKEKGIKKYRKIPKDIKCELFLDFVIFDEYTCTAAADICW